MREIKFRAFANSMIIHDNGILRKDWKFIVWVWDREEQDVVQPYNDAIFMQYTWLKDKNWKEIYEGDILVYKTSKTQYSPVRYISDWFKITTIISPTSTRTSNLWNFLEKYQCKVAGNTYENPELLK